MSLSRDCRSAMTGPGRVNGGWQLRKVGAWRNLNDKQGVSSPLKNNRMEEYLHGLKGGRGDPGRFLNLEGFKNLQGLKGN